MWGSRLLITVSMADISVLHSVEVVQLYPQIMGRPNRKHFQGEWLEIHYEAFTEYT
jgi:hypothetical protein